MDLAEIQRLTAALELRGVRPIVYRRPTEDEASDIRANWEADADLKPELRGVAGDLALHLLQLSWTLPEIAGLEHYGGVVMFGIRNPNPLYPGPMSWTVLFPEQGGNPILHRVLMTAVPPPDRFEAELRTMRFSYDRKTGSYETTPDEIIESVDDRLTKGYTIENLPLRFELMMRVLYEIGTYGDYGESDQR